MYFFKGKIVSDCYSTLITSNYYHMKLFLFLFAFTFSFCSFSQTKKYFRSVYETIFTDFVGVYPITEAQIGKLNYYELNYNEENQLVSIAYFSKYENLSLNSDILRANRLEFEYNENTKQVFAFTTDWNGELVMSEEFMEVTLDNKQVKQVCFKFIDGEEEIISSLVDYNYSSKGKLFSLTGLGESPYYFGLGGNFHSYVKLNANNQVVEDELFVFIGDTIELEKANSKKLMFDQKGNLLWLKEFDENGEPYNTGYYAKSFDENGYLSTMILFNNDGKKEDQVSVEYIGEEDSLVFNYPCETRWVNDAFGNVLSKKTFNKKGEPFEDGYGVFEVVYGVDLVNGIFTESFLNAKKEAVTAEIGYSYSEIRLDAKGRNTYEKYLDASKKAIINEIGVAIVKHQYNDTENLIYESYYDELESPMVDNSGGHNYERSYDDYYGFYETVYDIDGNYMGTDEVYDFRVRSVNLGDNYIVESVSYFDLQRNPMLNSENYFQEKNDFDDNLNILSIQYLDTELKPINAVFGDISFSKIAFKYDENQYQIEKAYLDADGSPSFDENTISVYKTKYDQYGNTIQIDRYNAELTLLNSSMSYATVKYKYDSNFMRTEEAFYNAKGELWQNEDGIARFVYDFVNGNPSKSMFYNSQNKPTMHAIGVYQIEFAYDSFSNITLERYLNKKGKKMNNLEGIHTVTYTYNDKGFLTSVEMRNKKKKLAMGDPLEVGIKSARIVYVYDDFGDYIDTLYFDAEGKQLSFTEEYYEG